MCSTTPPGEPSRRAGPTPVGGDADHLEQLEDIDDTVAAGFVFYTLDPKAEVDPEAEHADAAVIQQKVEALDWPSLDSDLATFRKSYVGTSHRSRARGDRAGRGIGRSRDGKVRPLPCARHGHVPAPQGERRRL
jgi:hypothetical protein